MSTGLATVVIPTYHLQAQFLPNALKSVLGQSYSPLEVVVVHDGSDKVLKTIERFRGEDKRVKAYMERGRGYIAALNQGIELSGGDHIAFCDSDDILYRDHVRVLVNKLEQHPEAGLVFDNLEYVVDAQIGERGTANGPVNIERRLLISHDMAKELMAKTVSLQDVFEDNLISGPAFMVLKRVFNRVGVFDEHAFLMNDLHLFYRIGAYFPIRFVDYLGVRKRVHAGNLTTIHRHYEYGVRCLENLRDYYPEVYRQIGKHVFNKKLGRKYYRLGLYYMNNGEAEKAKEMYKKAMVARKFSFRYHWSYLRLSLAQ